MERAASGPDSVLIFEDSMATQELLRLFFAKLGCTTKIFGDGEDAVERVRRHAPRLVMMDLMMPGRDGYRACEDIRRADPHLPIIVLSVKTEEEARVRALAAGATAYVVKPFRPADLAAVVAPLLGR